MSTSIYTLTGPFTDVSGVEYRELTVAFGATEVLQFGDGVAKLLANGVEYTGEPTEPLGSQLLSAGAFMPQVA